MKKKFKDSEVLSRNFLRQLFFIMKLTLFFLITSTLGLFATGGYSQNTRITLDLKSVPVREALKAIENESEFFFIYNNELINVDREIDINVKNQKITEVLNNIFEGKDVEITVIDRKIVLAPAFMGEQQPTKKIIGKVTDQSGTSLPGVSVVVKGTTTGVITDANGNYSLANIPANATLQFSFVGMKMQEIVVGNKTTINAVLIEEAIGIEEVVAVGYGTQSKRLVSSAIATIGNKQIANMSISNATQALVGQIAGVQLKQNSGQPGEAPSIRIRGNGSITSGNSPLYVIDGFPLSDAAQFNSISPNDIESIDILKDAASSAIYGSRAGNGVIVITTKKAKAGITRINLDVSIGQAELAKKVQMLNPDQFAAMAIEALTNQGAPIPSYLTDQSRWVRTDWQDVIFQKAPVLNYHLSATGGNEKVQFNFSGGYSEQQGILRDSYMKRYNMSAGFEAKLNKFINIGASMLPSYTEERIQDTRGPNTDPGASGVITVALSMPPILPVWQPNGDYFQIFQDTEAKKVFHPSLPNPLNKLDANKDYYKTFRQTSNAHIEIQPITGLKIRSVFNSAVSIRKRDFYMEGFLSKGGSNTGNISTPDLAQINAERTTTTSLSWYLSNTATYDFSLKGMHNFTALVGYDVSQVDNLLTDVTPRTDKDNPIAFDNFTVKNVQGAILTNGTSSQSKYAFEGVFGRINYNYKAKYLLSASIRRDRSSRFGPDNRAGAFPSVSVAWNISNEDFLKKFQTISQLKIRASYGETGNDQLAGNYPWISTLSRGSYVFGANGTDVRVVSYQPGGFSNPELGWEKNKQGDAGMELGLLNNRFNLSVDVYERNSNTILNAAIPIINGRSGTVIQNVGNIRNRGLEISVNAKNLVDKFKWNTDFNISFNRNLITKLGPGQTQLGDQSAGTNWASLIRNYVGRPMGDIYMYVVQGTFNNASDLTKYAQMGVQYAGDLRFEDVNHDGKITSDDIKRVGNYQPDFTFGLGNRFSYKNFELNILLDGSYGGKIVNATEISVTTGWAYNNDVIASLGHWKSESEPGSGYFQKLGGPRNLGSDIRQNTRYLYNSSFLRVRNLNLSYNVPEPSVKKYGCQGMKIYFEVLNLYTFTKKYTGYNPEANFSGDNAIANGVDHGAYPLARTLTIGLNLSF